MEDAIDKNKVPHQSPPGEQTLAMGLEFASRCATAKSYDEVCFILTNDLRILAGFDRCFLITHFGQKSGLVAATHQPTLEGKSRIQDILGAMAPKLRELNKPVVIDKDANSENHTGYEEDHGAIKELRSYMDISRAKYLCLAPLIFQENPVGHLLMEYEEKNPPGKTAIMTLVKMGPSFASALTSHWILENKPSLAGQIVAIDNNVKKGSSLLERKGLIAMVGALIFALLIFAIPVTKTVGGEAEIVPQEKQYAFCKIGGLIKKVFVKRGSEVKTGQILAVLDSRDLDHSISKENRHFEILGKEIELLRSRSFDDPSKLARGELLELKRQNVKEELNYLLWQREFLNIKSPGDGLIVTKDVDTLSGKKLEPGAPFCEIAETDSIKADVFVPEERILSVRHGQKMYIYLNNEPGRSHELIVEEISAKSQVKSRLGNVFKVSGRFLAPNDHLRIGMKGIGKIHVGKSNVWSILSSRLIARWNQLSIYFY